MRLGEFKVSVEEFDPLLVARDIVIYGLPLWPIFFQNPGKGELRRNSCHVPLVMVASQG
jgi:hypothetical protein